MPASGLEGTLPKGKHSEQILYLKKLAAAFTDLRTLKWPATARDGVITENGLATSDKSSWRKALTNDNYKPSTRSSDLKECVESLEVLILTLLRACVAALYFHYELRMCGDVVFAPHGLRSSCA